MPFRRNPRDPPLDGARVRFEPVADDRAERVFWSDGVIQVGECGLRLDELYTGLEIDPC